MRESLACPPRALARRLAKRERDHVGRLRQDQQVAERGLERLVDESGPRADERQHDRSRRLLAKSGNLGRDRGLGTGDVQDDVGALDRDATVARAGVRPEHEVAASLEMGHDLVAFRAADEHDHPAAGRQDRGCAVAVSHHW